MTANGNGAPAPAPPARRILSIRLIVAAAATGIVSLSVLTVGGIAERNSRLALTGEIESRLLLEARNLAAASSGALLSEFPELSLHPMVKGLHQQTPDLAFVVVMDHQMRIQGHEDARLLGSLYQSPSDLVPVPRPGDLGGGESLLENNDLLVARAPALHSDGTQVGTVEVGMRRTYIETLLAAARRAQTLVLVVTLVLSVLVSLALMSYLLRPVGVLHKGLARIGRGDLTTRVELHDRTELGALADAVNDMADQLRAAQEEMMEKERMSRELELARDIQHSLLPHVETVSGSFRITGTQQAAAEVGGDYFDYFALPGGRIGVAVADVAGKGLAGCLVMSMLSALLRAFKDSYRSPSELLIRLDERLSERLRPGTFVTMFYGVLDPGTGILTFASAGHSPAFLYRRATGAVERLSTRGIPLGAIRGDALRRTLEDHTVRMEPGDVLLQYTDGINESFEPTGREQFGFDRMARIVTETAAQGARAVVDGLRRELDLWVAGGPRLDDETLVVLSREVPVEDAAGTPEPTSSSGAWLLQKVESDHSGLHLAATAEELSRITTWIEARPELAALDAATRELIGAALYEACANIVEHGYGGDATQAIDLWWIPGVALGADRVLVEVAGPSSGIFLLMDRGHPFRPDNWEASNFGDPEVWRRGRGFGLDIIYRTMARVVYQPSTSKGNMTVMVFDPAHLTSVERSARYA